MFACASASKYFDSPFQSFMIFLYSKRTFLCHLVAFVNIKPYSMSGVFICCKLHSFQKIDQLIRVFPRIASTIKFSFNFVNKIWSIKYASMIKNLQRISSIAEPISVRVWIMRHSNFRVINLTIWFMDRLKTVILNSWLKNIFFVRCLNEMTVRFQCVSVECTRW